MLAHNVHLHSHIRFYRIHTPPQLCMLTCNVHLHSHIRFSKIHTTPLRAMFTFLLIFVFQKYTRPQVLGHGSCTEGADCALDTCKQLDPRGGVDCSPIQNIKERIAAFQLIRGPYAWMGYSWQGCAGTDHRRPYYVFPGGPYKCPQNQSLRCSGYTDGGKRISAQTALNICLQAALRYIAPPSPPPGTCQLKDGVSVYTGFSLGCDGGSLWSKRFTVINSSPASELVSHDACLLCSRGSISSVGVFIVSADPLLHP
jgi:hypothetical protein